MLKEGYYMDDFEEIGHSGGKIEIIVHGNGYNLRYNHCSMNASACFFVSADLGNQSLSYLPAINLFSVGDETEDKGIPIPIISDKEGFFGRKCPNCDEYFRMNSVGEDNYCPYCGYHDSSLGFMTDNQRQYIESYLKKFFEAMIKKISGTIDLDSIIDGLTENKAGFVYNEQRQQTQFECGNCSVVMDILGEYGYCPGCGKRNTLKIFIRNIEHLEDRVNNPRYDESQREKREREWSEIVKSCVSDFEAFCNDLNAELLKNQMTPIQRRDIGAISFQNINNAREVLKRYFAIDLFDGLSLGDEDFLNKMFNKRHILTHKSGIVDQEYIKNTNDNSVRSGQKIRIRSNEVKRLIELILRISNNFFMGFESFS